MHSQPDILQQIMRRRLDDVETAKQRMAAGRLRQLAAVRRHPSLKERLLASPGQAIIAEMKKASPSAGLLRDLYNPSALARRYADAGAAGISVLTEPHHFRGSLEDLCAVRRAVDVPLLRKDFVGDAYQVLETAARGGDVLLLIVTALDEERLRALYEEAVACGLEVLAESHSEPELETALGLEEAIVGVNSRNLKTLETNLDVARKLSRRIPSGRVCVAESGIRTRADVLELAELGFHGFLVGETLMVEDDPSRKLRELLGEDD